MAWWYAEAHDGHRWTGPYDSKEEAIDVGRDEGFEDGGPFTVAEASQSSWRFDCFDRIDEEFDGANEELGDGEGDPPSIDAGMSDHRAGLKDDLRKLLEATLEAWVREHGKPTAWALEFTSYVDVPATEEWHKREQGID